MFFFLPFLLQALKFEEASNLKSLIKILRESDIICSDTTKALSDTETGSITNVMPDLGDPIVQEFILKLLFRDDFKM